MTEPHVLPDNYSPRIPDRTFRVTDAPFRAAGDGRTECREAIQRAIDEAARQGGGRVVLPAGGTYRSAPLFLRNHVELHIEEGAVLQQTDVQWVVPVSSEPSIHAMNDAHCAFMSTVGKSERRGIVGTAAGTTDASAIAAAMVRWERISRS